MLFNSFEFLLFFPIVTILYWLLPHKFRWAHLLVASCLFYMFFIPKYILILFFTIIIDYIAGLEIQNAQGKKRKLFLIISIIANVGILVVFKYYNFFIENINEILTSAKMTYALPLLGIILPIGLSFHTFQAMSYTIEVYRGNQKAETHFGIYALYVMFYPQLVAGPIERPQNVLFQFHRKHKFSSHDLLCGLRLMAWGFFKKVVVADRLSNYVDIVYNDPTQFGVFNHIIATVFFSIQIYCDFSGYSDIALGVARVMGFELMVNFNRPYLAKNIREFWSKWHISLSTWFRDYVYIPLGGNRVSLFKLFRNTAIIFLISGFWHGASWNFVIWGALHAIFSIAYIAYSRFVPERIRIIVPDFLSVAITFVFVALAWVFFRAESFQTAQIVLHNIFTWNTSIPFQYIVHNSQGADFGRFSMLVSMIVVPFMFIIEHFTKPRMEELSKRYLLNFAFLAGVIILVVFLGVFQRESFIYFQF